MKLSPLFTVKNNQLYKIADNSVVELKDLPCISAKSLTYNTNPYFFIEIPWSLVEIESELYNEDFLAGLRDFLKKFEEKDQFAIIRPVADKPLGSEDEVEAFIAAFNHTARRIKDCTSLIGMELTKELTAKGFGEGSPAASFIETLAIKHDHYVYCVKEENCPANADKAVLAGLPVAIF